ncbi:hypothetical protein CEP51_008597 [Fusarium floridanum]|uniref:Uncharacterized protein n=1 Tax=Fusarium floridanum TaxID=1325733 RepID=A0A428RKD5_9HYPO|nr:hypothetical protein CEP51_008597 [Fusarium floridanum]
MKESDATVAWAGIALRALHWREHSTQRWRESGLSANLEKPVTSHPALGRTPSLVSFLPSIMAAPDKPRRRFAPEPIETTFETFRSKTGKQKQVLSS